MIEIEIRPAWYGGSGYLTASGHAGAGKKGSDLVCCAVSALIGALQSNLERCRDVRLGVEAGEGLGSLRWSKTGRGDRGLHRANTAAGFVYNALKDLEALHPGSLRVRWRPGKERSEEP